MDDLYEKVLILENNLRLRDKKIAELLEENDELREDNDRLQGLYQDEHCEVLRLTNKIISLNNKCNDTKGDNCLLKETLKQVNDYIKLGIPIKVIQGHGNIPMIYYADFQNEIKNPILNLIKEVL